MTPEEHRTEKLFERLVIAVEKIAGTTRGRTKPSAPVKGLATVIPHGRRETMTNDGFSQGGTDPEEFFRRPDRDAQVHPHER